MAYAFNDDKSKVQVLSADATYDQIDIEKSARVAGDGELNTRIDNILREQDLDPNKDSELVDIRTGYDGVAYSTAGDAVRTQIENIESYMRTIGIIDVQPLVSYPESFIDETHGLMADGSLDYVEDAWRTTPMIPINAGQTISFRLCGGTTSKACIAFYDTEREFISSVSGQGNSAMIEDEVIAPNDGYFIASHRWYNTSGAITYIYIDNAIPVFKQDDALFDSIAQNIGYINFDDSFRVRGYYILASNGKSTVSASCNSTNFIPVKQGDIISYRLGSGGPSSAHIALYEKDLVYKEAGVVGTANNVMIEGTYTVPYDCYIRAYDRTTSKPAEPRYFYINGIKENDKFSICNLNKEAILDQQTVAISKTYGDSINPFSLLHFSDIHGDQQALTRLVDLLSSNAGIVDDSICTGDMVANIYDDDMDWWDSVSGSGSILMCIGNHDVAVQGDYSTTSYTEQEVYDQYFSTRIANWGVTYTANKTYYYKDYVSKKIRLIVLNCKELDADRAAQDSWLETVLEDARQNGLSVVIAEHYPPANGTNEAGKIKCNFTDYYMNAGSAGMYTTIQDKVETFINNGGDFVCYICGHTHRDFIMKNVDYPNQIFVVVANASISPQYGDFARTKSTKFMDCANFFTVDINRKLVKLIRIGVNKDKLLRPRNSICFNYLTGEVLSEA